MKRYMWIFLIGTVIGLSKASGDIHHFETYIRPYLVAHCYECHSHAGKQKSGFTLDDRAGLREGGDRGPAIVPGDARQSLLMQVLQHEIPDLRMPKSGPKASAEIVEHFERWINDGAVDPRDQPPTAEEFAEATKWETVLERRKQWWSFLPLNPGGITSVDSAVSKSLVENGLSRSPRAEYHVLIRRLFLVLTGLPPTERDLLCLQGTEVDEVVDELLASSAFGERWARHWMDWWRYADSHGSEGDPMIPYAWQYRDYLIRALNADVPYDDLIREHLAGDLLDDPRVNSALGLNESAIGPAHFRMVFHGFAPTDALDELVRFTDNQVDVVSKATMGITVSCARCHDHKFDAISQQDFYAMFGIFASGRPAVRNVQARTKDQARENLLGLKQEIKRGLAKEWLAQVDEFPGSKGPWTVALKDARENKFNPLYLWARKDGLAEVEKEYRASVDRLSELSRSEKVAYWDLRTEDGAKPWVGHGRGVENGAQAAGSFTVLPEGGRVIRTVRPAGVYSDSVSSLENGILSSPRFDFSKAVYVKVAGDQNALARYVVQNYPRKGTVFPVKDLKLPRVEWVRWDTGYWEGDQGYIELSTAADQPVLAKPGALRSWFGIQEAVVLNAEQEARGAPRMEMAEFSEPLFIVEGSVEQRYRQALTLCCENWVAGTLTDGQAQFLSYFVEQGLLPVTLEQFPQALKESIAAYRALDVGREKPVRVPGILEGEPLEQPLFVRGDHKQPGEGVPQRFLEAFGGRVYASDGRARLALAEDVLSPKNPLTSRVIVNRLWHHVFGKGLVATPDNLGALGEKPSHPELLDYLAIRFRSEHGGSIKSMLRELVLSETFCASSESTLEQRSVDPANRLLSHYSIRRMEAETLRDTMLAVSGQLDRKAFGPGEGENVPRRSVYLRVVRNRLHPFLTAFDMPEPLTSRGRRNVTNVPAQSLALMNDPFVINLASKWVQMVQKDHAADSEKIDALFLSALSRRPSSDEKAAVLKFLQGGAVETDEAQRIRAQIVTHEKTLARILDPVRERLQDGLPAQQAIDAVGHWVFDPPLKLDGSNFEKMPPIDRDIREKTFMARVALQDVDQRGGGVISLQTPNGGVFDSLVFGERDPGEWIAGSDNFRRTKPFMGTQEEPGQEVSMAISYAADGTITGYRNGLPYGQPYRSRGLVTFKAGEAEVLFGLRHSPAGRGRLLKGTIYEGWLFDRALRADEIAAAALAVSAADVLNALSIAQRKVVSDTRAELDRLRKELVQWEDLSPQDPWRDLAQSMFNLKEFIYVR